MERNQIRFNVCIETCINRPPISISPPTSHAFPLFPLSDPPIRKQIVSLPTEVQLAALWSITQQTMECLNIGKMDDNLGNIPHEEFTLDGTVDQHGRPAVRATTGKWFAGVLLLVNQGLATLAFFGVGVNLVLFLTRVMGQDNAEAANNVSKWTGTVYIFSLLGAFLSDSYWGRYKTCAIFQAIFVAGLVLLSLCSYIFLIKPNGCGDEEVPCGSPSSLHTMLFYVSIYLIALGNGGYQPTIATFGSDQFDEDHPQESQSKLSFFSYFYLALNLGSLFSNTILVYFEDKGMWTLGFWASAGSAILALVMFLVGTPWYRHFKPTGNPISRFCQVVVAAIRKWKIEQPSNGDELYEGDGRELADNSSRNILHTKEFRFLDKAAIITSKERLDNPWRLCPVTQVEEVKCILRLFPIWLCTILYSVVFTQMASLFVEQGDAMKTMVSGFHIPPASMSSFDILSVAAFIFIYRRVLDPLVASLKKSSPRGLTELQRMGVGLIIAVMAMLAAGIVEHFRLKYANKDCSQCTNSSSLSIFWQVPQYVLIGASEVFMYVGQLEFFNGQTPDGLKSFGSALCMTSISLGNYVSSLLVSIVIKISTNDKMPGWIPGNLNKGHLDRFYFLLAALTIADFVVYLICAKWYKYIEFEQRSSGKQDEEKQGDLRF
ncbi:protein NRT1/ PTR FAMILY 7.3-like [Solanum stenotomum]|uniref:protein NRT1/ PTR FAMILY 7.3-like n=1 Tax=Solanum stenotomum TaxID=172797 RepID=UPI0020D0DB5F|nr:protein NRT1/ PTR FAMILY 7.3-like [Solanum stenotomum]